MGKRFQWARVLPMLDLASYRRADIKKDALSALTLTFLAVPQGVAFAMIAGLPPVMGLYASCLPLIVGSLFRSSRNVITGPTNALSLLVGTAGAAAVGADPVPTVLLLTFLVGSIQLAAGVLRLGVLVDYISIPVVIGYITGAGILIGIGQLHHLTETTGGHGNVFAMVRAWLENVGDLNAWAVGVGALTAAGIVALRTVDKRIPGALLMLAIFTAASWLLDAPSYGLTTIADLSPVPAGLPPLTLPFGEGRWAWSFDQWQALLPIAIATTVLSLVESTAVARAIAARTGQRIEISTEFVGQGLANLAAAFTGGYPVSGSLSRSVLTEQTGAVSRLVGVFTGVMVLGVLLAFGPAVNHTPIASLAGLLFVVSYDLVDVARIKTILAARGSDPAAFLATVLGTWILRLDDAIYVGVALSVFLFLRRARLLSIHHLVFDDNGRPMELRAGDAALAQRQCTSVRMIQLEGQLFFGAAGELASTLDEVIADREVKVVWLRMRRAFGMDVTITQTILAAAARLRAEGRHLVLVGLRPRATEVLKATGAIAEIGEEHVFPKTSTWFDASDRGLLRAMDLVGEHACGDACPIERHLGRDDTTPRLRHREPPSPEEE